MKKNMLTILILALVLINVILSSLVIFVVLPASSKTNKLLADITTVIGLELDDPAVDAEATVDVNDLENFLIEQELTPNLKLSEGETKVHYASIDSITLSLDKKAKNFKTLKATLTSNVSFVTDVVNTVISSHTLDEANGDREKIKAEIIAELQKYFDSDFIVNIAFGNLTFTY